MRRSEEDERRRSERAELLGTVEWRDGDREHRFDAENVSVHGLAFAAPSALRVGARIELVLCLPPGFVPLASPRLALRGRVVRCEPRADGGHSVGVELEELGAEEEATLEKYVRRRTLIARPY